VPVQKANPLSTIDITRPNPIQFVPLAIPPHAHRTARTVQGSQRTPQNRMAGARIDSRSDGRHRQRHNLFSKGEALDCRSHPIFFTQAKYAGVCSLLFMKDLLRHLMASIFIAAVAAFSCHADEGKANKVPESLQICSVSEVLLRLDAKETETEHGGGLNACGCHFNRKTGECHCHQARSCGCSCQPATCR
jgi:hypothetical protein